MDTPERPDASTPNPAYPPPAPLGPVPQWAPAPAAPAGWDPGHDPAAGPDLEPPARPFNPKVILVAMRRHWWKILLLWLAASAGLVTLIFLLIKPTYEATAMLRVEQNPRSLTAPAYSTTDGAFLNTQVNLLTSSNVLAQALQEPKVQAQPLIKNTLDAMGALRAALRVQELRGTQLFTVSMTSTRREEPVALVDGVVNAYMEVTKRWADRDINRQRELLESRKKTYEKELVVKKEALTKLIQDQDTAFTPPAAVDDADGKRAVTADRFERYYDSYAEIQTGLIAAQAQLDVLKQEQEDQISQLRQAGARSQAELDDQVRELFAAAPAVADLLRQIGELKRQKEDVGRVARRTVDPAAQVIDRRLAQLQQEYESLWQQAYPKLLKQLAEGSAADQQLASSLDDQIRSKTLEITALRTRERQLRDLLDEIEVESRNAGDLALQIRLADAEVTKIQGMIDRIDAEIAQLDYEQGRDTTSITVVSPAGGSPIPSAGNRVKLAAAAPVGVLALLVGLFTLLEMRAGRVADPDDLPARVRLGVLGVVPPLPALGGPSGSLKQRNDERRRVEEFVQSLDHLRVALYAARPDGSRRRCVLITSAVGGEGKTTLAAQLAGRCANAGLLTVLVDADLRRPSLGELLEVPEGAGLAEVLDGEVEPEAAMVVIGNAGGFHLLPAGAPGRDPSRLLHSDRLPRLIEQLRATFDVVIVDAPPVLAVPDALLLGRCTDGAVIAVRHDSSRFPLVERAQRRLAAVGVPVLGAVVNGCRTMESNYGAYQYNPYAGRGAEDAPA